MITNQDGLGTSIYPEDTFWPVHNFVLETFKAEGIEFDEIFIDRTFVKDNAPTRKPNTGLLTKYFDFNYDLENSFVIGDRLTDIELAKNLNAKGIFINDERHLGENELSASVEELKQFIALETNDWEAIYNYLKLTSRTAAIKRNTNETRIQIDLNLDGNGKSNIDTGIAFFDHMLDQLSRHGHIDLNIKVEGDLEVDEHHTIEDVAIALVDAFKQALGERKNIERKTQRNAFLKELLQAGPRTSGIQK